MTATRPWLLGVLVLLGVGWGLTPPLAKLAVSEGYRHFGIIFWQLVISVAVLGLIALIRGQRLPWTGRHLRLYLVIAMLGTILPNYASYEAARHLPAGILAILISLVPMFALPIALLWRMEGFEPRRLAGVVLGAAAVVLIVGPETSLPDPAMAAFVPLAMVAPFCYALEGNYVARHGTLDIGPLRTLLGASIVGAVLAAGLALATGQFIDPRPPWGAPDAAIFVASCVHAVVYASYVWLVGQAGAVFASQVAYLVTGSGVVWAMLILSESYSGPVWAALGLMMLGLFLVQPRAREALAEAAPLGKDGA